MFFTLAPISKNTLFSSLAPTSKYLSLFDSLAANILSHTSRSANYFDDPGRAWQQAFRLGYLQNVFGTLQGLGSGLFWWNKVSKYSWVPGSPGRRIFQIRIREVLFGPWKGLAANFSGHVFVEYFWVVAGAVSWQRIFGYEARRVILVCRPGEAAGFANQDFFKGAASEGTLLIF